MNGLPGWVEVIVAFAALVTALGVLWKEFLRPALHLLGSLHELVGMLPWLRKMKRASENLFDKESKP